MVVVSLTGLVLVKARFLWWVCMYVNSMDTNMSILVSRRKIGIGNDPCVV
jgi:hypothetical protein